MTRTKRTFLALLAVLLSPMAANADLIDSGITTIDTDTGLEWLDMTLTAGSSYNDVIGGFGGYVTSMGYRYATGAEVFTLFSNAGIPDIETLVIGNYTAANVAPAQALIALIGTASSSFMDAIVADIASAGSHRVAVIQGIPNIASATSMYACTICGSWSDSARESRIGSFLVRATAVPEPGTLALLGIGLLGMGAARRRKKA